MNFPNSAAFDNGLLKIELGPADTDVMKLRRIAIHRAPGGSSPHFTQGVAGGGSGFI
jgi:hypothetical protein